MIARLLCTLAVGVSLACTTTPDTRRCEDVLVVVLGATVSPNGALEAFQVHPPTVCEGEPSSHSLSRAWKVSVCMAHATRGLNPTYATGSEPVMKYMWHIYDLGMPHRVLIGKGWGSAPENPVILIDDELPALLDEKDPSHICAGNLDAPAV